MKFSDIYQKVGVAHKPHNDRKTHGTIPHTDFDITTR